MEDTVSDFNTFKVVYNKQTINAFDRIFGVVLGRSAQTEPLQMILAIKISFA